MSASISPRSKRLRDAIELVRDWPVLREDAPEWEAEKKNRAIQLMETAIFCSNLQELKIKKLENELRKKNKRLHIVASRGAGP